MKSNEEKYTRSWFAGKLADYLSARHPDITNPGRLIERRSRIAAGLFRQAILSGANVLEALGRADAVLYSGLIFSRFDMV